MFKVRCHGRGGMGVKMTAHTLGRTAFYSGYQTQDFALYGAERRGAPVMSFVRYDKKPIKERGYIFNPNAVIILDEHLNFETMLTGLKADGFVLINSKESSEHFRKKYKIKQKIYCVDATDIAMKILGKPIANMAILGAFVRLVKLPEKKMKEAIRDQLKEVGHPESIKGSVKAAEECMELIK